MLAVAAALSEHPDPAHAVGETAGQVLDALGPGPDLLVAFVTAPHREATTDIVTALRTLVQPGCLVASTASAVLANGRGVEESPAVALWAAHLPAAVTPVRMTVDQGAAGWYLDGFDAAATADASTLLLLADPFTFPADGVLASLRASHPRLAVMGGFASGGAHPAGNRLAVDGDVVDRGAVGVLLGRRNRPSAVVSQGCRPIGQPFTVTASERNVLLSLGGRTAYERLVEALEGLSPDERGLALRGLHCGIAADEHRFDFGRGDFLVRNVLDVDRATGAVAVGDEAPVGTTVQFHVRDPDTAAHDLSQRIAADAAEHGAPDGALVFTCNGRGSGLFGTPHHDAQVIDDVLPGLPHAGMFCAGELGPVAGRNAVHGFTASLAVFRDAHL